VCTAGLSYETASMSSFPQSGGTCPEGERLLRNLNDAVDTHAQSVSDLVNVGRTNNRDLFLALRGEVEKRLEAVRSAWHAYFKHVREHGC